ncbi:MAG: hypothetical protein ACD_69C00063G0002 [uncultured bacterium]|nr:MAG: hypothetical protein ACD_69C00063G0002 [uncultured bacterium]HBY55631.1 epimerase [Coxiellaceae bacterium]
MSNNISILGAGFIGLNLVNYYLSLKGYKVRVLDRNPKPKEMSEEVEWIQGNLGVYEDIVKAISGSQIVFHLISNTVPGDMVDINKELFEHVLQTIQLLDICVRHSVKRVIFISSASVYGIQSKLPISESSLPSPISSHGIQKLTIEHYLHLYLYDFGLDYKIMRLSNPYGKGQNLFGRQGIISILLGNILSKQKMKIRGDGTAIRDYIYIDDVIRALFLAASTESKKNVFNIGSGQGVTLNEVVYEVSSLLGQVINVEYIGTRKADIPSSVLDVSLAQMELGFTPRFSLRDGLKQYLLFNKLL